MTLVDEFYVVLKSVYIFGICPFKLNKLTNNFYCAIHYTFYSVVIFIIVSFTSACVYLLDIFNKGFISGFTKFVFDDTLSTLSFVINCTIVIIYSLQMLHLIFHRFVQVNFLNKMLQIDQKVIDHCLNNCIYFPNVQLPNLASQHLFLSVLIILTYIPVVLMHDSAHLTALILLWTISVLIQVITIFQIPIFIRNCALILNRNFSRVYLLLNKLMEIKTRDWQQTVLSSFELFEDLEQLKRSFSNTFGVQILFMYLNDFVHLTSTLYFFTYQLYSEFNWFRFYLIIPTCFLNVIKCLLLTSTLDKLGEQVNEMKKYASKVSAVADKRLEAAIDLFFLKLQHMEKRKYVTANDFFPINYAMLYNIGGAIITHMKIILQFQQWEESSKIVNSNIQQ